MKKINWIFEKHLFPEYEKQLVDTIKNSGQDCYLLDDSHWNFDFDKSIKKKYNEDNCVIFYGSLNLGQRIWKETNFIPGIYLTRDNYECYKYYSYYGDEMVNSRYMLLGLNDVKRSKDMFFEMFNTNEMFIRPSNGYKTFTGQLLPKENFDYEFDIFIKTQWIDIDQLVLIAPKQNIREENRFIVFNENDKNRVIDGNKYMIDRVVLTERVIDKQSFDYVNTIVNNYTPDKAFTIDIAKMDDGTYKVLEIGSFCCAGWYNMNLEKVVNETNILCNNEYNDYFNIK